MWGTKFVAVASLIAVAQSTLTSPGWWDASLSKKSWSIEIREPATTEDRRLFQLTEGRELFRRTAYAAAAKHFELARRLDPGSLTATLSLVGAYERLGRYRDAVKLSSGECLRARSLRASAVPDGAPLADGPRARGPEQ
jgi:hypothetical protein